MREAAEAGEAIDLISDAFRAPATPYGDGFPWDDDMWTTKVEHLFVRGTRFDAAESPEYYAEGTIKAHGGPADQIPIGGPAFNVSGGGGGGGPGSSASFVPLENRCVIDGLYSARLFAVGDAHAADCRWPTSARPPRFVPGSGGAVPALVNVPGHPGLVTATGGYSPWGSAAKRRLPWTQGAPGRRCGRLVLERLVLRRGWSDTDGGAAVGVYGGDLELRTCVVERARTGPTAGRGGAVVNKG